MLTDLRFVLRALIRNRVFTVVTVLTLALGIGGAAAIFSVTDWILFQPQRFPKRVVFVAGRMEDVPTGFMPIRFDFMVRAYEQTDAISEYAKAALRSDNVVVAGQPVATSWAGVTPNLFSLLGITPALGRTFAAEEAKPGHQDVVVVSDHFWREHLGAVSEAIGRRIRVGASVCTIVGVLRPHQTFPFTVWNDVYRPLVYQSDPKQPWDPALTVLGRLRDGLTREQALARLRGAKLDVPTDMKTFVEHDHVALFAIDEANQAMARGEIYWILIGAVGFLYAIACLNASNLLLVRMLGQRRELSIRLALGGSRWRIVRLLGLESVTLASMGTVASILIANWMFPLLLHAAGNNFFSGSWMSWNLSWRALGVMAALTILTSIIVAILPAWRILRTDISSGLKDGGAALGESPALARLRGILIVLQAAFAVVLLCGAGMMIRTFQNVRRVDLGFDPGDKVKLQLSFPPSLSRETEPRLAKLREIASELERVPGVRTVGFGDDLLLRGWKNANTEIAGPGGATLRTNVVSFGAGFQNAAGLRLLRGDWLTQTKGDEVLVNASLARTLWPNADPLGQYIRKLHPDPGAPQAWQGWRVVGVVGDTRSTVREKPELTIYGPEKWGAPTYSTFIVRLTRSYDETLAAQLRRRLYGYDPQLVVTQLWPLATARDTELWAEHMADSVLKVLSGLAVLLTVTGMFSVLAYTINRRMGEFGVRVALGAKDRDLIALVVGRGALLATIGLGVGIGTAFALTRSVQSLLYETSAADPFVLGSVAAMLLVSAVAASAWPAYRATKVDVTRLLRAE